MGEDLRFDAVEQWCQRVLQCKFAEDDPSSLFGDVGATRFVFQQSVDHSCHLLDGCLDEVFTGRQGLATF